MNAEDVARLNRNRAAAFRVFRFLGAILGIILLGGTFIFYRKLDEDTKKKESWIVSPVVDEDSVVEIGYVQGLRREIHFWEHSRDVMWWVKVPATNKVYSCGWQSGYSGFDKDDGVRLIHNRNEPDGGFIVGLHDKEQGHSAAVWVVDVDDLYDLLPENDN